MTLDKVGDIFPLLTKHLAYAKQKGIPRLFINATILSFFLSFLSATRRYLFFFSFPFKNTSRKDKVKFKKEFSYSSSNRYKRKSIAIIYILSLYSLLYSIYICVYTYTSINRSPRLASTMETPYGPIRLSKCLLRVL